jgi:hypothetical protein
MTADHRPPTGRAATNPAVTEGLPYGSQFSILNSQFLMTHPSHLQPALRRLPRPRIVITCTLCGVARATNYPACPECYHSLEDIWLADWHALLNQERIAPGDADERLLAEVVLSEFERQPWTVVNIAMTLVQCSAGDHELGGGPLGCAPCETAWGNALWSEVLAGRQGLVTRNEHALHVGRMILRHRHRQSANIVAAWQRTVPRLLTGWLPTTPEAQRMMALVKQGRLAEVDDKLRELDQLINREGMQSR